MTTARLRQEPGGLLPGQPPVAHRKIIQADIADLERHEVRVSRKGTMQRCA
ncbi:MAG TPA: hypothetical protein VFQ27_12125 [Xanthobacteraceae bacterium]|nr:hypothetical protein [Xanthobacteraceae bacterium]